MALSLSGHSQNESDGRISLRSPVCNPSIGGEGRRFQLARDTAMHPMNVVFLHLLKQKRKSGGYKGAVEGTEGKL